MLYDQHQINAQLPKYVVEKGQQLVDQQAVTDLSVKDNGATLSAKVSDPSAQDPLSSERVFISIHPQRKHPFTSECSCDLEESCMHVAAVLLHRLTLEDEQRQRQSIRGNSGFMSKIRSRQAGQQVTKVAESAYQQLIYLLSINKLSPKAPITVELVISEKQPSGEYRTNQPYHIQLRSLSRPPRFLRMVDPKIFKALLDAESHWENQSKRTLPTQQNLTLLETIIKTQRCYFADTAWQAADSQPIQWGQTEPCNAEWKTSRSGIQTLRLCHSNNKLHILPASEPFYIARDSNTIGALASALNNDALAWIAQGRKVEPEQCQQFIQQQQQLLDDWHLPSPSIYPIENFQCTSIIPQLLFSSKRAHSVSHHSYRKPTIHDSVLPQFVYAGPREDATFFQGNTQTEQRQFHQGVVYQLDRNKVTEKQLMDTLFDIAPSIIPLNTDDSSDLLNSGKGDLTFESKNEWKQFFLTALPQLKQQGWQAVFEGDFRYHFVSVEQW
ncbi:MAG: hypothetical protein COA38_21745, partial [Fluviicola sp.]